jgi:D-sedoheptulose 7-phosphate isomerase
MSARKLSGTKPGGRHVVGPGGLSAEKFADWYRAQSLAAWKSIDLKEVARLAEAIDKTDKDGGTVYIMGNGGSAATASHLAVDLAKTACVPGRRRVKAVCLNDNVPSLTAIGNDLSFDQIFSHQIETLVEPGDLVLLISGSGNSPNLLAAADAARRCDATIAALLGFDGGKLLKLSDLVVHVRSEQYGVIEDLHMSVGHMAAFYLKQR